MAETLDVAGELVTVSCDNHREELASGLWNFFQSSYAVDFVTQWGGRSILAHRLILDVFLSPEKLGPSARGAQPEKPSGSGLDRQSCLASLVEFLYTGKVTIHKGQLPNLLEAARESDFKMLVEAVELTTAKMASEEAELAFNHTVIKEEQISEDEGAPGSTEDHIEWLKVEPDTVDTNLEDYLFFDRPLEEPCEPEFVDADEDAGPAVNMEPTPTVSGSDVQHDQRYSRDDFRGISSAELQVESSGDQPHPEDDLLCSVCCKSFQNVVSLKRHMTSHNGTKDHRCHVCSKSFACKQGLTTHLRSHVVATHDEIPRLRVIYQLASSAVSSTVEAGTTKAPDHLRSQEGTTNGDQMQPLAKQRRVESVSKATSASTSNVEAVTAESPYSCTVCGKKLSTSESLRLHERSHVLLKPHGCSMCTKMYRRKDHLNKHLLTHVTTTTVDEVLEDSFRLEMPEHPAETTIVPVILTALTALSTADKIDCDVCKKSFSSSASMMQHCQVHPGVRPYKCEYCSRTFACECFRTVHEYTHTRDKPHKCPVCSKMFHSRSSLNQHSTTHRETNAVSVWPAEGEHEASKIRPAAHVVQPGIFRCKVCQKTFLNSRNLTLHSRVHDGVIVDKAFRCSFCENTFDTRVLLIRHTRCLHIGERPY